jgi:hypothetical protein
LALRQAKFNRHIPAQGNYFWGEAHHSAPLVPQSRGRQTGDIDLCEEATVEGYRFLPMVRDTFGLVCSLYILFMRQGQIGSLYQDGDLDNRVKTLLDALRAPTAGEIQQVEPTDNKDDLIYCLLEDDKLVTGVNVETRQLLNRRASSKFEVHLVIDVDVRVTHPRAYNQSFLGARTISLFLGTDVLRAGSAAARARHLLPSGGT